MARYGRFIVHTGEKGFIATETGSEKGLTYTHNSDDAKVYTAEESETYNWDDPEAVYKVTYVDDRY